MPAIQLMKKALYAVSLVFTQRFSVGHFWSPHRITTASIFCKLHITTNNSISYKYSVSIC